MINYESLIKACVNLELDPTLVGGNHFLEKSRPIDAYDNPINLEDIGFPDEELKQVVEIGKIIFNLKSQFVSGCYNLGTVEGKERHKRDSAIKSILPTLEESLNFWFKSGLKKSKEWKDLVIYNGRVFELNPGYQKFMEEMNKRLAEVHRDFIIKQAKSERGAENIILR